MLQGARRKPAGVQPAGLRRALADTHGRASKWVPRQSLGTRVDVRRCATRARGENHPEIPCVAAKALRQLGAAGSAATDSATARARLRARNRPFGVEWSVSRVVGGATGSAGVDRVDTRMTEFRALRRSRVTEARYADPYRVSCARNEQFSSKAAPCSALKAAPI